MLIQSKSWARHFWVSAAMRSSTVCSTSCTRRHPIQCSSAPCTSIPQLRSSYPESWTISLDCRNRVPKGGRPADSSSVRDHCPPHSQRRWPSVPGKQEQREPCEVRHH